MDGANIGESVRPAIVGEDVVEAGRALGIPVMMSDGVDVGVAV